MFSFRIQSLTFSDRTRVELEPGGILFITGPNSAGKTVALQDIHSHLRGEHQRWKAVHDVETEKESNEGEYYDWLSEHFARKVNDGRVTFQTFDGDATDHENNWKKALPPETGAFYCHYLGTRECLQVASQCDSHPVLEPPARYIHVLQRDEELRSRISGVVRQAFGLDLLINRGGGRSVWFHVGEEPQRDLGTDQSIPYLTALEKTPKLDEEGDGVRSFVGAVLATMCGKHPVLLIDEPEAFLHPPQARRLGEVLARTTAEGQRQLIVATHSSDVMHGALDVSKNVSVCRIVRVSDINRTSILPSDRLKALWTKPLLRSSASVTGLFHDGVVVCEAVADCRLYEAVVARLEMNGESEARPIDLFFTHGVGKGSLAELAGTYTSVSVPVAVIADLDLMRQGGEFKKTFEALGGTWSAIESEYRYIKQVLDRQQPVARPSDVALELDKVAAAIRDAKEISSEHRASLHEVLDTSADWSEPKKHGLRALSGGDYTRGEALLNECAAVGLFLVPVGELEQWWKSGSTSDKGKWFVQVIELLADEALDPDLNPLMDFVRHVREYFEQQESSEKGGAKSGRTQ